MRKTGSDGINQPSRGRASIAGLAPSSSDRQSSGREAIMGKDTWLKLHTSLLTSAKFLPLPAAHKWAFICMLILAKKGLQNAPEKFILSQLSMTKTRWKRIRNDFIVAGLLDDDGLVNGFNDSQLSPAAWRKRKQRERDKARDEKCDSHGDSRVQSAECRDKNPPTPQGVGGVKKKSQAKADARLVVDYWNGKHCRKIQATGKIEDRLRQGATIEECKLVIDFKTRVWTGTKLQKNLQPSTLFAPSHFEDYLSEAKEDGETDGIIAY